MKQVLIIGAGAQGNVISGILATAGDIGTIVLGDIDRARAEEVQRYVGSDRVHPVHLDAGDVDGMAHLIADGPFDLVINATLLPFVRPILEACSSVGVDYLDMASEELLEPITQETVQDRFLVEQLEWDQSFRQAGKRALIGAGGDPGLVNIMARDAADQLDVVDAIRIKDYGIVEADEPVALWSMTIFLEDSAEPAPYWENGEYKWAAPFTGEEEYYFPPPLDHRGTVFYHCHEEPVTLPHFIGKPVGYCDFKLGDPNMETWRFLIEGLGMMNDEPIEVGGQQVVPRDVLYRLIPKTLSPGACIEMVEQGRLMSRLQLAVDVEGSRDGERRRHKLWTASPDVVEACRRIPGSNDVSWITSVPASVLALMLLRGQIHHEGVFPCEVLDPDERESFFAAIAEWGITIHREVTSGE